MSALWKQQFVFFILYNIFQALTEDVNRQVERERALQVKYGNLQEEVNEIQAHVEALQFQQGEPSQSHPVAEQNGLHYINEPPVVDGQTLEEAAHNAEVA